MSTRVRSWFPDPPFSILLVILCVVAPTLPQPAAAQSVRGRLEDSRNRSPVSGGLVLLIDSEGTVVAGSLSDVEGRFLLRAPGPGVYRVKAERIAYAEVWSSEITVEGPTTFQLELSLSPAPIALSELEVTAEQVCHIRPEDGLGVSRVWEEARKALTIQDWTEQERLHRFRISQFRSMLGSDGNVLSSESFEAEGFFDRVPFRSLSADELQARGYVQRRNQLETGFIETEYFAPDASVLLSDSFLETHCFRLSANGDAGDLIGVAFEPVRRSGPPNIEGVLWVDRESSELRFLEFRYTPNSWKRRPLSGGRVEFDRLPDGSWVVHRWAIRMPTRRGYIETGAQILEIAGGGDESTDVTALGTTLPHETTGPQLLPSFLRPTHWPSLAWARG